MVIKRNIINYYKLLLVIRINLNQKMIKQMKLIINIMIIHKNQKMNIFNLKLKIKKVNN